VDTAIAELIIQNRVRAPPCSAQQAGQGRERGKWIVVGVRMERNVERKEPKKINIHVFR
jgi:hypothetical protein